MNEAIRHYHNKTTLYGVITGTRVTVGFSNCHKDDKFNRKTGLQIAKQHFNEHKELTKDTIGNVISTVGITLQSDVKEMVADFLTVSHHHVNATYEMVNEYFEMSGAERIYSPVVNFLHPNSYKKLNLLDLDPILLLNMVHDMYIVNASNIRATMKKLNEPFVFLD